MRIAPAFVLVAATFLFASACSDGGSDGGAGTAAGAAGMTAGASGTTGGAGGATGGAGGMGSTAGAGGMTGGAGGATGGSGGMTGGAGGTTGGTGGMTGGGDPDSGACDDTANACTTAGVSCDGNQLVTCEEDSNGCLAETRIDCAEGGSDYCDQDAATPVCASCDDVEDACATASASCAGETLTACALNADGCLVETTTDCTAGNNDYCDEDATTPVCVGCASLEDACAVAGTGCNDDTTLATCAANADGCLVETTTDCTTVTDMNACSESADPDPACVLDVCRDDAGVLKDDVCIDDQASCSGEILITCVPDVDGCPIATTTDCTTDPGHNSCDDALPTPACVNDPCVGVTNCTTQGSECRGPEIVDCEPNLDGCLVETIHDCTVNGTVSETCDPNQTPHVCVSCVDDARCGAAVEGDTACNGDVFETCTDTDADGCLNRLDENCGADFACDAADGCEYNGGEVCVETVAAGHVFRDPGTYGPFNTTGAANDYGPFSTCPGINAFFPFTASAPDILFALDVPPRSVIDVALDSPSGFTGAGAWMTLLSTCTADAEATCSGYSDGSLDYTNTSAETVRVYLVVDATGAANVGMFGLAVDTRPLHCGDGKRDGNEECDDGDIFEDDGCAPDCSLEAGYACTDADPSVCTLRPDPNAAQCGNVMCEPLDGAPADTAMCCTAQAACGVAYEPYYGASCIQRVETRATTGTAAEMCSDEAGRGLYAFFVPQLDGCCRADRRCGLTAAFGAGCVERTAAWAAMLDGPASTYYSGAFLEEVCTP